MKILVLSNNEVLNHHVRECLGGEIEVRRLPDDWKDVVEMPGLRGMVVVPVTADDVKRIPKLEGVETRVLLAREHSNLAMSVMARGLTHSKVEDIDRVIGCVKREIAEAKQYEKRK